VDALRLSTLLNYAGGLVETSSIVLVLSLLLESDRLTLISRQQIQREQAQGLVTTLAYDMSSTRRPIGLTTRRNWRPTATQIRFIELLRESARRCSEIE
jgi:DNA-binding transcriptional LysR family regulator